MKVGRGVKVAFSPPPPFPSFLPIFARKQRREKREGRKKWFVLVFHIFACCIEKWGEILRGIKKIVPNEFIDKN